MTKYVKLSKDQTAWKSALFSQKPNQVRRFEDADLYKYDWYPVVERKAPTADRDLYEQVIDYWEVVDNSVYIHYKNVLRDLDHRRQVIADRVNDYRNEMLGRGIVFKGHNIDTREETYKRVMGVVISSLMDSTYETDWITNDNYAIHLTGQDIADLGNAFERFEGTHVMEARLKKDTVLESLTPETFDYKSGWPSNEFFANETV